MGEERDPYFAFSDPTRRAILELLRDADPTPAGEIAAQFPGISREAVSRHLRILREAGVITATRHGREQLYQLNRERLHALHTAFFARFAPAFEASLASLKDQVEGAEA